MTTVDYGQANLAVSCALIDQFASSGVRHAIVCPGSRSTPLAVALAAHPLIRVWVLVDERSAAYFALGMARHLGAPVALLSTSGTAAANFYPAVAEAMLSRIPLIVLTADRPPELRDWGAAQTIDQTRLYGSHALWSADLPVPDGDLGLGRHARAVARRAVQTTSGPPRGPVHLNVPFREPLLPVGRLAKDRVERLFASGQGANLAVVSQRPSSPAVLEVEECAAIVAGCPHGVIVCGPDAEFGEEVAAAVAALSAAAKYPILADPLSGVRFGCHDRTNVIESYDSVLRHRSVWGSLAPGVVIRIGAIPTSKPLQQFLSAYPDARHLLIDPGDARDPTHLAGHHLRVDPALALCEIAAALRARHSCPDPDWLGRWRSLDRLARDTIASDLRACDEISEPRAAAELAAMLPEGATLVVGNSMPVRDLDTFGRGHGRRLKIVGNRGANGIDGVMSSTLGAAAVAEGPVLVIVGDLSFYHDLNGLLAAKKYGLAATIVVLNNDGGGIFSFLPQWEQLDRETFEELFGTPIGLNLAEAARIYGARYERPADWPSVRAAASRSLASSDFSIIELVTDRERNAAQHRAIGARVAEAVAAWQDGVT